jgi:D,D-heptose 1,7-bisphosphate phosphatase
MKQAVILAGGKGTRLTSELAGAPKPLIDINGYPLLYWQFKQLKSNGFDSVILLVNYEAQQIIDYCLSQENFDLSIEFVNDGSPLGTAGSVLNVIDRLHHTFLLVYGDTYFDIDLKHFWSHHTSQIETSVSIFLHPNDHPYDSDLVEVDDKCRVLNFHPYPHQAHLYFQNLVNAALYICNRDDLLKYRNFTKPCDFAKDLFPQMVKDGSLIYGYISSEYIKDAGTPDRLAKVRQDVFSNRPQAFSRNSLRSAVFIDRDGTLNEDNGYIVNPEQLHIFDGVGQAMAKLNQSNYISILITNQPVVARGNCSIPQLRKIHAKLETELAISGSFLDAIYFCPHHPDAGFIGEIREFKVSCECRKPSPGLLRRAEQDHNLNMWTSWMIGDSTADFGAAQAVGVSSILVETGSGGLDGSYPYMPDFSVRNFSQAVDFVINKYPIIRKKITDFIAIPNYRLVFIGGLSRSGKSTLASLLQREWRLNGNKVHVLRTDSWLLSQEKRGAGMVGRHDIQAIEQIIKKLVLASSSTEITIPYYLKKTKQRSNKTLACSILRNDIVIVEGVIGLYLANLVGLMSQAIYVNTDENGRRCRFEDEYTSRGYLQSEIYELYKSRMVDECEAIIRLGQQAGRALSLDDVFKG